MIRADYSYPVISWWFQYNLPFCFQQHFYSTMPLLLCEELSMSGMRIGYLPELFQFKISGYFGPLSRSIPSYGYLCLLAVFSLFFSSYFPFNTTKLKLCDVPILLFERSLGICQYSVVLLYNYPKKVGKEHKLLLRKYFKFLLFGRKGHTKTSLCRYK